MFAFEIFVVVTHDTDVELVGDLIINSSELHVAKPEKKFWETAFSQSKKLVPELTKEEILVIDDSRSNCQSAEEFGFHSFIYKYDPEKNMELKSLLS